MIHEPTWRLGGPGESNYIASCPCGWKVNLASADADHARDLVRTHQTYPEATITLSVKVPVIDSPTFHLALHNAVKGHYGDDLPTMPLGDLVALAMGMPPVDLRAVARSIGYREHFWGPRFEWVEEIPDPQEATR